MSLKRQKLDTTTLTFPATITKNCFFHGSITFVSLFFYQNSELMRLKSGPLEQTSSLERVKAENKIESRMQTSLMAEAIFLSGAFSESFKEGSFM